MDFKLVTRTLVLAIAGGSFALTAFSQWQWIDKDGRKVFSDRPPPAEIQEKNIVKRPAEILKSVNPLLIDAPPANATALPEKAGTLKLSGKDAELEARKKKAENEAVLKKNLEESKNAKATADNCERAKSSLAMLQSGMRIASVDANGEREIYDDVKRAAETRRLQDMIAASCP